MTEVDAQVEEVLSGRVRAASQLIRRIEEGDPAVGPAVCALYRRGGRAKVIGLTGAPGVGKSTLTDQLIAAYRAQGKRVAVLAVDPTSPFTGGAVLGDRIRMSRHFTDRGVFIRSMATRGHLGGLSRATGAAVHILDATGWEVILVETVGVGQAEVDVLHLAETVLLMLAPGAGDDVQAAKAGVMEIAHIFVVNKAKRAGADETARMIEEMLHFHPAGANGWRPPVLRTEAIDGTGIAELIGAIAERMRFLEANPAEAARLRRVHAHQLLIDAMRTLAVEGFIAPLAADGELETVLDAIVARQEDPYTAAARMLSRGERAP